MRWIGRKLEPQGATTHQNSGISGVQGRGWGPRHASMELPALDDSWSDRLISAYLRLPGFSTPSPARRENPGFPANWGGQSP